MKTDVPLIGLGRGVDKENSAGYPASPDLTAVMFERMSAESGKTDGVTFLPSQPMNRFGDEERRVIGVRPGPAVRRTRARILNIRPSPAGILGGH